MVKTKKLLSNITRSQNQIRHLLHTKFPLGETNKKVNKRVAAEEYAYCFLSYKYQVEGVEIKNLESIKEKDEYQFLVNSGTTRITEWNRNNGKFPNEDIDFLCYFFECLKFNLFFKDIDDCAQYEKKLLIESLNFLKKHHSTNLTLENDDNHRYYDLALSAIKFYLTFNPRDYSSNISSLIDSVEFFLEKNIFPYTYSLYDYSLHDFTCNVSSSNKNKNLKGLINQLYSLSPKLYYEHSEMNDINYQDDQSDLRFKNYNDLNRFLQLNISRFEAYNQITGKNGEEFLLQLEKTAIKNWKRLFDGVKLDLKVHSFQSFSDDQENQFSRECNHILEENILVKAISDLSLETLTDVIYDYKNAKHAYDVSDISIDDVKEDIFNHKKFISNNCNDNMVLPRLIYEYYQYNNSLELLYY